jgi:hypothetical protein
VPALRVSFQSHDDLRRTGTLREISALGAFVETSRSPHEGATVAIEIESPTAWDPIRISGMVVKGAASSATDGEQVALRSGFNLHFVNLSAENSRAIRALLELSGFEEA